MNLVQINERLKDMPLQAVQQYANGMNPEIPPYLALGELQRRETMHKQMATAQGAAAGPQPSVKEQIEQKAGLMALQMQQAKQAQQQMGQPRMGPVPENVPQPTPQPEPEMAMAHGGIARLPVRPGMFDFAGGGIIAFGGEDGSEVDADKAKKKRRQYALQEQGADWVARKEAERENDPDVQQKIEQVRKFEAGIPELLSGTGAQGVAKPMIVAPPPVSNVPKQEEAPPPRLMDGRPNPAYIDYMSRKGPAVSSVYPDESMRGTAAGLPAGLPTIIRNNQTTPAPRPPAAPRPPVANVAQQSAPAAPAAPSAAADSGIPGLNDPAFLDAAKRAMAEPSQQQAITDYEARKRAMGLADPYGKEQEARINALNTQYQKGLEDRGLERLMRVLQARNMGEYGSRYLGSVEQERAADLAHAAKMNELLGTIESKRREEGMGGVKTVGEEIEKRRGTAAQTASSLGGAQMQANVSRANQLSQNQTSLQIAQLDRQLRERLHNTPAAQIPSIEKEMLDVYTKQFGGDRIKAYEHLKTLLQENKSELSQPQLIRKYVEDWNKLDPVSRMNYEKQGIKNVDDYVAYLMKTTSRLTGGGKSTELPPGFKLDK